MIPWIPSAMLIQSWMLWSLCCKISLRWTNCGCGCNIRLVEISMITCSHVWHASQCLHVVKVKYIMGAWFLVMQVLYCLWIIHTLSWSWVEACCRAFWSAGTCPGKGEAGERKERAAWSCNTNSLVNGYFPQCNCVVYVLDTWTAKCFLPDINRLGRICMSSVR